MSRGEHQKCITCAPPTAPHSHRWQGLLSTSNSLTAERFVRRTHKKTLKTEPQKQSCSRTSLIHEQETTVSNREFLKIQLRNRKFCFFKNTFCCPAKGFVLEKKNLINLLKYKATCFLTICTTSQGEKKKFNLKGQ